MLIIPYRFTLKLQGLNHPDMELLEYMPAEKTWYYYKDGEKREELCWLNKPEFEPTSQSVLEKIKKEIKKREEIRRRVYVNYYYEVVISKNWKDFNVVRLTGTLPTEPYLSARVEMSHIWEQTKALTKDPGFCSLLVSSWCWPARYEHWLVDKRPSIMRGKIVTFDYLASGKRLRVKTFDANLDDKKSWYQVKIQESLIYNDSGIVWSSRIDTMTFSDAIVTPFRKDIRINETTEKVSQLARYI